VSVSLPAFCMINLDEMGERLILKSVMFQIDFYFVIHQN
jgi:hypothetical protein